MRDNVAQILILWYNNNNKKEDLMISETELIRKYCSEHKNDIFDVGFLHKTLFNHLSESSFRKFVSRLADEKILFPVGKGIYTIGQIDDLENVTIKHYTYALCGMPVGDYLFYLKGINEEKPDIIELSSNRICGGKTIGKVKVYECGIFNFSPEVMTCITYMESLKAHNEKYMDWLASGQLENVTRDLKNLTDAEIESLILKTNYSRMIYIQLAKLFKVCDVSSNIENYIEKKWNLVLEKVK